MKKVLFLLLAAAVSTLAIANIPAEPQKDFSKIIEQLDTFEEAKLDAECHTSVTITGDYKTEFGDMKLVITVYAPCDDIQEELRRSWEGVKKNIQ